MLLSVILPLSLVGAAVALDAEIYIVAPPVTDTLITADLPLPPFCRPGTTISLRACPGEVEPASFIIKTKQPLGKVRVRAGPLSGPGGELPADAIDIRVVKDLYRQRWGGPGLFPIVLVHRDDLLRHEKAPKENQPEHMNIVATGESRDSEKLLPVRIDRQRRFWITVRLPRGIAPGTYRGEVRVVPESGDAATLDLSVEVYPFELLPPMIEYSIYYPARPWQEHPPDHSFAFGDLSEEQYRAELENMLDHGISNPILQCRFSPRAPDGSLDMSYFDKMLDLRESVGMRPKWLFLQGHPLPFDDKPMTAEQVARTRRDVAQINGYARRRGYEDVYYMARDEWWGEKLKRERDSMKSVSDAGGKIFVAINIPKDFFDSVGDVLDLPMLQAGIDSRMGVEYEKYKTDKETVRLNLQNIGKAGRFGRTAANEGIRKSVDGMHRQGKRAFTYMNPAAGVPLPDLHRRNQGLGMWRVGFDGTATWAYTHIEGSKQDQDLWHAYVFRLDHGVLDTLHYEGLREGVDDVRYLTTLLSRLGEATGRFPDEPIVAETRKWLAEMDAENGDLDEIRAEMARRIVALQGLGYIELTPEELLAGIDPKTVQVIALPESWRFRKDPNDAGVTEMWYAANHSDDDWVPMRTDRGTGWERQGFGGDQAAGFGWYRTRLPVEQREELKPHRYLYFEAVDEEAWVYLNGKPIFENTVATTGLPPEELWNTPFVVPLDDIVLKGDDLLAARVFNIGGMGGIWRPVHLVLSEAELNDKQLRALVKTGRDEQAADAHQRNHLDGY